MENQRTSYTDDYISKLTKRKQFSAGWYCIMTTAVAVETAKSSGAVMFVTRETPLKNPTDPDSKARQSIQNYLVTPLMPEDNPEFEPSDSSVGMCMRFLRAKGLDVPEFPRRGDDGVTRLDGEALTKEQAQTARQDAVRKLLEVLENLREEPEELEGYTAYAYVEIDGDFNKIKTMRSDLPEGASLVDPAQWFAKQERSDG